MERQPLPKEITNDPYYRLGEAVSLIGILLRENKDRITRDEALKFIATIAPGYLDNHKDLRDEAESTILFNAQQKAIDSIKTLNNAFV